MARPDPDPGSRQSAARRAALVAALLVVAAGALALFWTLYDPVVPLAEPLVVTRPAPVDGPVTVVLGGDFAPTDAALPSLQHRGYRYPYEATANLLRDADIAFANLEAPITRSDASFWPWKDYLYKVDPVALQAFQWLGLDLVSLANNHAIDYRERGLLDTLEHLEAAGIAQAGGGADEAEARRPVIFDVGGVRVGFLAYLEHKAAFNLYLRTFAVGDRAGCARLGEADVREDVARLRPLVDVLVVSVHWGWNYADVTGTQEEYARLFAELGVDVVAGHHPHDVQPVEIIGSTVVLYSLGNYAWGTPGRAHMRVGLLARLQVSGDGLLGVELIPIATQNRIVHFQPRPLEASELEWLDPLLDGSQARGTELELNREARTLRVPLAR